MPGCVWVGIRSKRQFLGRESSLNPKCKISASSARHRGDIDLSGHQLIKHMVSKYCTSLRWNSRCKKGKQLLKGSAKSLCEHGAGETNEMREALAKCG